jgi:hypothetical protein
LWLHIVLQIGLLSEQETTKTLQLLRRICDKLGIQDALRDPELNQLIVTTQLDTLARELEASRQQRESPAGG